MNQHAAYENVSQLKVVIKLLKMLINIFYFLFSSSSVTGGVKKFLVRRSRRYQLKQGKRSFYFRCC